MWTVNVQMFKLALEKAEEQEIKLPTSAGSLKKQESSRKTSISALLTMPKLLTGEITKNWKILKEMGIPDHLTYLLRNLHAGQEATVRTGHGTTDWFQIGKGVHQGCILSPCLFNLYAEWSEVKSLSHVSLFATPWTVAHQAPQSMGFSRQEYWSGLPFPSPEYIMWNAWLDEEQARIKIARRNINKLRYADDTTLMAESERGE